MARGNQSSICAAIFLSIPFKSIRTSPRTTTNEPTSILSAAAAAATVKAVIVCSFEQGLLRLFWGMLIPLLSCRASTKPRFNKPAKIKLGPSKCPEPAGQHKSYYEASSSSGRNNYLDWKSDHCCRCGTLKPLTALLLLQHFIQQRPAIWSFSVATSYTNASVRLPQIQLPSLPFRIGYGNSPLYARTRFSLPVEVRRSCLWWNHLARTKAQCPTIS